MGYLRYIRFYEMDYLNNLDRYHANEMKDPVQVAKWRAWLLQLLIKSSLLLGIYERN